MASYNNNYNRRYDLNRKRKNTDDSYDDDYKKQRVEDTTEEELESLIYRLGDPDINPSIPQTIESNIQVNTSFIINEILTRREQIINLLIDCASKLPEKLTVYTTLLGLINSKDSNFIEEFIESLATHLKENLKNGHYFIVHRLIRFISDLVNVRVVSTKSLMNIYQGFVELTSDEQSPQVRSDFYIYCVLSSLPWNGKILYESHGPAFDELFESIKSYISKRRKDYLPLIKVWSNDDPHPQEEYLDCIWFQTKKLEENDWKENQILRPYVKFEHIFLNCTEHDFPMIVPIEYHPDQIFPLPRAIFRMFDYTDVPEEYILPGAHSIERYLVEERLHSVINSYYIDRKLCANKLLRLNVSNKIPLNYMIVEIIFAQLFTLPKPPHIELFYGSLLLELCRLQPNFMPQVLAQATELIFERIEFMKTSCIERFSSWFAYHLSNFQFKWSWDEWKDCLSQDMEAPKNKFLRETLVRCMRLSYHQRLVDFMPESMSKLIPAQPKPTYKYESEEAADLDGTAVANRLLELFKSRAIPEDIFQALRDIPDSFMETENDESYNPLKIEVFTSTLLYFGNKSFSHAFAALAKYHMIFKMLVDNEKSQIEVLKALHDVWKNHQQMMIVMVDKMLKTQIVDCSSVAKWIFSDSMKNDLTCFYVWEILNSTIHRMNQQVDKFRIEYDQLNEKYKKSSMDPDTITSEVSEIDLEQKLQTLNALKEQQVKLFNVICERFIYILNDHFTNWENRIEDGEKPPNSLDWLKWVGERFENVLLTHNEEILTHLSDLKKSLITDETNEYTIKLFDKFSAFKK